MKIKNPFITKNFKNIHEIISYLNDIDSSIVTNQYVLLFDGIDYKIWIISILNDILLIKDDGKNINVIFRRNKSKFIFVIMNNNLYIDEATIPIPINSPVGGMDFIKRTLNLFKE
jgi:hypothetical protein